MEKLMKVYDVLIIHNGGYINSSHEIKNINLPFSGESILIDEEITFCKIESSLANRIFRICDYLEDYNEENYEIKRLFNQLYAIKREITGSTEENLNWDNDNTLQRLVQLSRLVHPTSISYQYNARVFENEKDQKRLLPRREFETGYLAYVSDTSFDYLTFESIQEIKRLWPIFKNYKPVERIAKSLWHYEYACRLYYNGIRTTLITTALEALISTDGESMIKQFKIRIHEIAKYFNIDFSKKNAVKFYILRSHHVHGDENYRQPSNRDNNLYITAEKILRLTLKEILVNEEFRNIFKSDESVREKWPID